MMNYAGFWRRYVALVIDALILILPSMLLGWLVPVAGSFVVALLYKPVFESSPLQGTPGKALMGLMVLSENGGRLNFKQALIRYAVSIISGLILLVGYLMNLFTAKRQTLHDMVAGTIVVKQEPPDVNYFHIWLEEVKAIFNGLPTTATSGYTTATSNQPDFPGYQSSAQASSSNQSVSNSASSVASVDQQAHAIETLHKLAQSGAITMEEYEAKKQQILSKLV